jgi:tetratricopeptide (TPR) repeat protein
LFRLINIILRKTQIALNFAHTRDRTHHVFWVHAATLEHFYADYLKLGTIANIFKGANKADDNCDAIREWLDSNRSGEWVLIIDNLDILSDGVLNIVSRVLPQHQGTIFITSRNSQIEGSLIDVGFAIHLDEMSFSQAKETFQKLSGLSRAESNSVTTVSLLKQLGNLPLAIAQAAAYIHKLQHKTAKRYLADLQFSEQRQITLLERPVSSFTHIETRTVSVMTTWELSFEHIRSANPSAARLLQVMSLLDCQSISRLLLTSQALKPIGLENEEQLDNAMGDLLAFSLVTVIDDDFSPSYQLHPLVSLWTRKSARCADDIIEAALLAVQEVFPQTGDRSFLEWSHLLPHANSVVSCAQNPKFLDICTGLNYKTAAYYLYAGDYNKSDSLISACYEYFRTKEGPSEEVFWCVYHIGELKLRQGQYPESIKWYQQAKKASEDLFDSQHPILIKVEMNLALLMVYMEDLEAAMQKFKQILQKNEVDDEITLRIHGNMGSVFTRQGKGEEALEQYRLAARGWEKLLGPEDIETLVAKGALAAAYRSEDDFAMAIQIFEEVVPGLAAVLGDDHPRTLEISSHMAVCLKNQGRYKDASNLYQKVLAGQERKIGKTHRLTLNTLHNMGENYLKWKEYERALTCFERVLEGREQESKGGRLPQVYYATLDSIGDTYKARELYDKAIDYYERAWDGAKKLSSEDHPFFLDILQRKSDVLVIQGKYEEAFNCLTAVFRGRVNIYQNGHVKLKETCDKMADVAEYMSRGTGTVRS